MLTPRALSQGRRGARARVHTGAGKGGPCLRAVHGDEAARAAREEAARKQASWAAADGAARASLGGGRVSATVLTLSMVQKRKTAVSEKGCLRYG